MVAGSHNPTWEAEAGESLEPRRWRLQWAEIMPLHSSLGSRGETASQKKKEFNISHVIEVTDTRFQCLDEAATRVISK